MITILEAWELGAFAQHLIYAKLMKETVALMIVMVGCPSQLITNVQVGSDVGMTIVHLNLSFLIGWIVATNQNGEDAKSLWT